MKTLYLIKNILIILNIFSQSGFVLQFFEATINLAKKGCLKHFRKQLHNWEGFIKFCDVYIKLLVRKCICWNYYLGKILAFKYYVLDFWLERLSPAKSFQM